MVLYSRTWGRICLIYISSRIISCIMLLNNINILLDDESLPSLLRSFTIRGRRSNLRNFPFHLKAGSFTFHYNMATWISHTNHFTSDNNWRISILILSDTYVWRNFLIDPSDGPITFKIRQTGKWLISGGK